MHKVCNVNVEPLVYTPHEFENMKNANIFIKEAITHGRKL